ncbi:MAG TPA: cytochrome c [Thermoanaerobaculia bacterium]|nr:cytochrome c [Thermoanaerobaculia bacterium]
MTFRRTSALTGAAALMLICGCRQEMYDQPKYEPLEKSGFYADARASRPFVEGTVPRGALDGPFAPPPPGGSAPPAVLATTLPMPLTRELLARGQERFEIFCTPCHDRTGSGRGMVVRRGYRQPPSYHIDRLRDAPVGHFYDVMTRGLGAMPDYAQQIPPDDRWAIAAYVKALQLSQRATIAELPPEDRTRVETGARETGNGKRETIREPGH